MNLEFTEEDLRTFFQENSEKSVGASCNSRNCPITRYFLEKRNMKVIVSKDTLIVGDRVYCKPRQPLEPWQRHFVKTFDSRFENEPWVLGKQAIDVLDEVIKDEDRIEHPYRHSLSFSTEEEAERVKQIIVEYMEGIFDPFISLDDDERITYELRFYTASQMSEVDRWDIVNMTDPDVYSFNEEDY